MPHRPALSATDGPTLANSVCAAQHTALYAPHCAAKSSSFAAAFWATHEATVFRPDGAAHFAAQRPAQCSAQRAAQRTP